MGQRILLDRSKTALVLQLEIASAPVLTGRSVRWLAAAAVG